MARAEQADGTIGKAMEVLDMVAGYERPVRFAELLAQSPFPKATLYRLLQSLTHQAMLHYDEETGHYAPGLRLVRLAHAAWSQSALAPLARPYLAELAKHCQLTLHLAQLVQGQTLYLDKLNGGHPIEMFSQAGKVGPAYCTGVGKAMLAYLDSASRAQALAQQSYHRFTPHTLTSAEMLEAELAQIRSQGFAQDREEHEPGIICYAVPILSAQSKVLGAISVTSSTNHRSFPELSVHLPALKSCAAQIARAAQAWRFPESQTNP